MEGASEDLPYTIEYAKSARASCKTCKEKIDKDSMRIGVMVQSPHFDGRVPLWHHFSCFFLKKKIKTVADVAKVNSLRYEDQQKLKNKISGSSNGSTSGAQAADSATDEFSVDYAKSSRSICKVCEEKIVKGQLRISKMDSDSEVAQRFGPVPGWRHVDCFVKVRNDLGFTDSAKSLPGFSALEDEDKTELLAKIKGSGTAVKRSKKQPAAVKKVKTELAAVKKEVDDEEKKLKAQSKLFFGVRDNLQKNLKKKDMTNLLELNSQHVPPGESRICDLLADCMTFGALEPCPECKGEVHYRSDGYKCAGYLTGWTKCLYSTKKPARRALQIDAELMEEFPFLKKYKYVQRDRIFSTTPEASASLASTSKSSVKPLESFKIVVVGNLSFSKADVETAISSLGGKTLTAISRNITCIITTKEEFGKNPKKMDSAKKHDIFVVAEAFLDAVKVKPAAEAIKENLLYPWGGDPHEKIPMLTGRMGSSKSKSELLSPKSTTKSIQKITVQGGAAVDPDSGLEHSAMVFQTKGNIYNAVLGMVDVLKGTNSYYKLQLLKHNSRNLYYVFRSWGRVGTDIGSNKIEKFGSLSEALKTFKELYLEKTANNWEDRETFVKQPKRFYPLDIDYGQEESEKIMQLAPGNNSKLPKQIQELICLIFNVEAMKKAMLEFEIDLQKMPLGKLSKKQIQTAYSVLTELQELMKTSSASLTKVLDASNRFYTLIPHDFGLRKPPMINDLEALKNKIDMLDSLMEIEIAYNLLKTGKSEKEDPIDQHYLQLRTDISVVQNDHKEFVLLQNYLTYTHAETHNQYSLKLQEVFKVNRGGEADAYKKFKSLPNKKLLWHGSRVTNYAGILSQGLRIAPPEAPVSGYMFGKGIYFADMVSKSANYCFANRSNPTGLLLLCEVALGDMYERVHAETISKASLPKGKHSTKGLGRTAPDPKEAVVEKGIEIPLGHPVATNIAESSLLYNEYIVYDGGQVRMKYLLKVGFVYKN